MTDELYSRFVAGARAQRHMLAPFIPEAMRHTIDKFEFLFSDNATRPTGRDLTSQLTDFVTIVGHACETAVANHGRTPELLDAQANMRELAGLLSTMTDADLVAVWTHRRPRPMYEAGRAPIFIVSSWRSGSTLLSNMLNTHPDLAALPEVDLLTPFVRNRVVVMSPDLPPLFREGPPIVAAQIAATAVLGTTHDEFYSSFANFIIDICSRYAATKGKRRFVLKEIVNVPLVNFIDLLFGYNAKFLWLVRHGFDVVASHLERYQVGCQPEPAIFAHDWVSVNQKLADFTELAVQRAFKIRYEDLLEQPQQRIKEILDFLGERSDKSIIDRIEDWGAASLGGDHKIHSSGGKIRKPGPRKWIGWPEPLLHQLGRIMNPMLMRAGYEPIE